LLGVDSSEAAVPVTKSVESLTAPRISPQRQIIGRLPFASTSCIWQELEQDFIFKITAPFQGKRMHVQFVNRRGSNASHFATNTHVCIGASS